VCSIFAIDVASYAILSNHYHGVVRVDRDRALQWTVDEVLHRWTQLFRGPPLVRGYLSEDRARMTEAEVADVEALAEIYRSRLYDLSWFMRTLDAAGKAAAIPFAFVDYLALVDWLGRAVHPAKRGHIGAEQPRILERLGIYPDRFIRQSGRLPRSFGSAIGTAGSPADLSARREKKYQRGIGVARTLFARRPRRQAA